jgi:hypothetical protein
MKLESERDFRINHRSNEYNWKPKEGRFDIGYVEDDYRRKLLWIISPILKEVILDLLMPHPGLCS